MNDNTVRVEAGYYSWRIIGSSLNPFRGVLSERFSSQDEKDSMSLTRLKTDLVQSLSCVDDSPSELHG